MSQHTNPMPWWKDIKVVISIVALLLGSGLLGWGCNVSSRLTSLEVKSSFQAAQLIKIADNTADLSAIRSGIGTLVGQVNGLTKSTENLYQQLIIEARTKT